MRTGFLKPLFLILVIAASAFGQTLWLDRPLNNWNNANGVVPNAPRTLAPIEAQCRTQVRAPESVADRAVTRAGWSLYGASQTYGPVTVVTAMAGVDGMCRPMQYNAFVFVRDRFAGTLAPEPMDARSDGSLNDLRLTSATDISAGFARYTSRDALCCPSQTSSVTYTIGTGPRGVVRPEDVDTAAVCRDGAGEVETQDNVVSGTVNFRRANALPAGSILTVRLVDVTRQDSTAPVIAEQRVELNGRQSPVSFDIAYDRGRIQDRNRYAVQAEIRDGARLLYITNTNHPVITQGNPRTVEITLAQVGGGGGGGGGQRENVIRGTVTYRQRIALAPNSDVTVKIVDAANPNGPSVAETTFPAGNRQVPIPFELEYQLRDIDRQRNYELQAEIRSGGQVRFRTAGGVSVTLRGQQADQNVELVLVPGQEEPAPITGRTISLSKFGTGSMQIGDRANELLIRGAVSVDTDGNATVTLTRPLGGSVVFTGKLTYISESALRITVQNSGDANAGGEIQIAYSGRTMRNITATNLVLDGQDVTVRF